MMFVAIVSAVLAGLLGISGIIVSLEALFTSVLTMDREFNRAWMLLGGLLLLAISIQQCYVANYLWEMSS